MLQDVQKISQTNTSFAKWFMLSVLLALKSIHTKGVAHADIKPANILTSITKDGYYQLQVIDFGLARYPGTYSKAIGTAGYRAPEVVRYGIISFASDIWAAGVTFIELLSGRKLIFKPEELPDEAAVFDGISNEASALLRMMITVNQQKRVTVNNAISHKYLLDAPYQCKADHRL